MTDYPNPIDRGIVFLKKSTMKRVVFSFGAIMITALIISLVPLNQQMITGGREKDYNSESGLIVMELFTSQGCSSCPSADRILGKYAIKNNSRIFPLAFHVDYWNRLGWVDSFSNSKYTKRQRDYADKFGLESVYTPQLVLNGLKELVGSEEGRIADLVNELSKEKSSTALSITNTTFTGSQVMIEYSLNELLAHHSINGALVQGNAITRIRAGENGGMNLSGNNLVRDFSKNALTGTTGRIGLQLPKGFEKNGFSIVLFVQDEETGKISAADKKTL